MDWYATDSSRSARRAEHGHVDHRGVERAAVRAGISREEMDAWALRSHRNAVAAIDEGRFNEEIVPIETPHGLFSVDEHPRRDTSMEKLAALKPVHPEIEGFSITAGNASGANDAAAVLAIASDRLGLPVLATVRAWASVGVDPADTGLAPVEAIPKAPGRAGISLADVDLFEINEAFASTCVATIKLLDIDPDRGKRHGVGHRDRGSRSVTKGLGIRQAMSTEVPGFAARGADNSVLVSKDNGQNRNA